MMKPLDWLRNLQFYLVGFCYLSSRITKLVVISCYTVYYVEFTLLLEKQYKAIVPLVIYSSGIIFAAIVEVVRKHVRLNIIFVFSCTVGLGKYNYQPWSYFSIDTIIWDNFSWYLMRIKKIQVHVYGFGYWDTTTKQFNIKYSE